MHIRRTRLVAAVVAAMGLAALVPTAISSAEAAPPALPHTDRAIPREAAPGAAAPTQPDQAPAAVPDLPDLPIQASDIALSFPDQPGTGVVLTDAARQKRAIAAAGGAAAWAKQKAKADAMMAKFNRLKASGAKPVIDSAPSGKRPYGGDMWSGGAVAANVASCSAGLASRATSGAQYVYTAGHCMLDPDTNAVAISPTTGVFCVGWITPCPSIDIGNTGHGGTRFNNTAGGDQSFIRANKAWLGNGLRAEVRTWDSRITVGVPSVGNPVYAESASVSGGMSGRLTRGTVMVPSQPTEFENGAVVKTGVMLAPPGAGCQIPGDSGGSIIAADHSVIGTLSGHIENSDGCWIFFGRAGDAFISVNQVPAPLP